MLCSKSFCGFSRSLILRDPPASWDLPTVPLLLRPILLSPEVARLDRAPWEQWAGGTFDESRYDNPRIMIVPMCDYVGGDGANAEFKIHAFGAFWLQEVDSHGQSKSTTGRFIDYNMQGAGGDALSPETGLWTVKMVG